MATCPKCGVANEAGVNFCGDCGAPLQPGPQPQPPAAAGWQAAPPPFPQQGQSFPGHQPPYQPQAAQPQYPPQQFPPQQFPPQQFPPQQFPPQQFPPQQGWQPAPPPKQGMGIGMKIFLGLVGFVLLAFVGLMILGALYGDELPEETPVTENTPQTNTPPTQTNPNPTTTPPANQPKENPLGVKFEPMAAQGTFAGAKILAKGKADFNYQQYDRFGENEIIVARAGGLGVQARVYEFRDGAFHPAFEVEHQLGASRDVAYGDMYNAGQYTAVVMAEKGVMIVNSEGNYRTIEIGSVVHTHIGDWDGDGKNETAFIHDRNGSLEAEVWRYSADGKSDEKLGQFPVPNYPQSQATTYLSNTKRKLILGLEPSQVEGTLNAALFTLDATKGFTKFMGIPLKTSSQALVTSYGAGPIAGKGSLVVSYQSSPSYVEILDLTASGAPSRGKITLPSNEAYTVVLGYFTQKEKLEIAAFSADTGEYVVIGF